MIGETIKWRMKIGNKINIVHAGIGLRKFLKNKDFHVKKFNEYDKHGCFNISSGGYAWTYLNE